VDYYLLGNADVQGTEGNPSKITDANSQAWFSDSAHLANSLCPAREKRTMHKPKV
jgi:hypothetical protein